MEFLRRSDSYVAEPLGAQELSQLLALLEKWRDQPNFVLRKDAV